MRALVARLFVSLALVAGCGESHDSEDAPAVDTPTAMDAPRGPCDSDRDCSAAGLICDRATGRCGECSADAECAGDTLCLLGGCVPPTPCATSRDCPGLVCDTARGRCVECNEPVDCDAPLMCRGDGRCARSTACTSDPECPGGRCDVMMGRCVECVDDVDCDPGERCTGRACVPPTCGCTSDADCDDGSACNGSETCAGTCADACTAGTPVRCDGGERCVEPTGACELMACELEAVWFRDADDDGFGTADDVVRSCTAPAGYVVRYGDCDDADVLQSPGSGEACDGTIDEDCDGAVDEGCTCSGFGTRPCGRMPGCAGTQRCGGVRWEGCTALAPDLELCGGGDEDCDGVTDEASVSFYCGPSATCRSGACTPVRVRSIAAGGRAAFAVLDDGRVLRWVDLGPTPTLQPGAAAVRMVGAGDEIDPSVPTTCAILEGGRFACGSYRGLSVRTDLSDVVGFGAGIGAGCAVERSGGVRCWGLHVNGVLGPGFTTTQYDAVPIAGVDGAIDVVVASTAACALRDEGDVRCWGNDGQGLLGNGTTGPSLTPVTVSLLDDATRIVSGVSHICVERPSGIWCWGRNEYGQLGDGTSVMMRSSPVPATVWPTGARLPRSSAAGTTCVLTRERTVLCVGEGSSGELGHGRAERSLVPVEVVGLTDVIDLAGYSNHWCALTASGDVYCWGLVGSGSLGDGTTLMSARPIRVALP